MTVGLIFSEEAQVRHELEPEFRALLLGQFQPGRWQ